MCFLRITTCLRLAGFKNTSFAFATVLALSLLLQFSPLGHLRVASDFIMFYRQHSFSTAMSGNCFMFLFGV